MKTPDIRFRIDFTDTVNLGPGKIELLETIRKLGSLSKAARALGLSYRRAGLLLESLNRSFDAPCTVATTGGPGGGGAQVTEFGKLLVERYKRLEKRISRIGGECLSEIAGRVVPRSRRGTTLMRTALARKLRR